MPFKLTTFIASCYYHLFHGIQIGLSRTGAIFSTINQTQSCCMKKSKGCLREAIQGLNNQTLERTKLSFQLATFQRQSILMSHQPHLFSDRYNLTFNPFFKHGFQVRMSWLKTFCFSGPFSFLFHFNEINFISTINRNQELRSYSLPIRITAWACFLWRTITVTWMSTYKGRIRSN